MRYGERVPVPVVDLTLEVVTAGPAGAPTCGVHGGTPSAALTFGPTQDVVVGRGLRHVTYSRPGYAGSGPLPVERSRMP